MNNVGVFLFNNIELLDFAGPYEVFSVTSELNAHQLFNVFTVSCDGSEIKSVNGLRVVPDFSFANHPPVDILVVPGGVGTKAEITKQEVLEWINVTCRNSQMTMSVCSGARILGVLGFLDHIESTTHHGVVEHLKELAPNTIIRQDKRFTDNGSIMTSGGISAGIDLSLHIVKKLHGEEIVNKTIRYMEYGDWKSL
jgi:transcriptional regulator GlxA family with amidase domain